MTYKKIDIPETGKALGKGGTKTVRAIKNAFSVLKKDFSAGTNSMADAWITSSPKENGQKAKRLKDGTIMMAKTIGSDMKKSFKGVNPKGVVCDISYELGGVIKKTEKIFHEYFEDITKFSKRGKRV